MDKITFNMASIPQRVHALKDSIRSILPQCDRLNIYLNNYAEVPAFLNHPKIVVYQSQLHAGDLGDVGKFFRCSEWDGYIFTVDDDILYPTNYVKNTIAAIEKYNRKVVVTYNGRILNDTPIKSYYIDGHKEYFSCFDAVPQDRWIHEGGTGVTAFHTDTVKPELSWFKSTNMSDVWFYLNLQKLNIPTLLLKHNNKWITLSRKYDVSYSIFHSCKMDAKPQTEAINSIDWKLLSAGNEIKTEIKNNRPQLLIKFPTRGRPDRFFEMLFAYYTLCNDLAHTRFVITCDRNDSTMNNPEVKKRLKQFASLEVYYGSSKSKIEACNADISGEFDIILLASDDMMPVTRGYDDIIRDEMLKNFWDFDGQLWFFDGYQKRINTLSVMGSKFYQRFNYIYHPAYKSFFCDDEQTEVGRKLNKIKFIDKLIIKHINPYWTGEKLDSTYTKNSVWYESDKQLFEKRKSLNFEL